MNRSLFYDWKIQRVLFINAANLSAYPNKVTLPKKMAGHCLQYPANASFWGETIKY